VNQNRVLIAAVPPLVNVVKLSPLLINACCIEMSFVNYRVTGPKLIKFLQDVARSSQIDFFEIGVAIFQSISECESDEWR